MKAKINATKDCTLAEAKVWLRGQFETGAICPCCNQGVKLRRQQIHRTMAKALIVMDRRTKPGEWVRINPLLDTHQHLIGDGMKWGSDVVKLKLWDFLEPRVFAKDEDGRRAGVWRITQAGRMFALGQIDALKYRYTYNGRRVERDQPDTERTTIVECLGSPFRYSEAMAGLPDGSGYAGGLQ